MTISPARRLEDSAASNPLCVVKLCRPAYFMASSLLFRKAMGIGANLINDPFPLFCWVPFSVNYSWFSMNSLIEREILPPRPMELYLPPLSRPCLSQSVNIYRICIGSNANLFKRRESAMARAILQSSVHTLVYPNLSCTLSPNFSSRSLNPFLKKGSFLNFS